MISEIRDLGNLALTETERQRTKTLVQQVTPFYTITRCSWDDHSKTHTSPLCVHKYLGVVWKRGKIAKSEDKRNYDKIYN